ncbi:unnamed protein product [Mucor fragilis]
MPILRRSQVFFKLLQFTKTYPEITSAHTACTKNTDKEDENARYLKDGEGQEATSFKMSCPCCVFYAQTKDDLSSHIQARHIHFVTASNNEATDNTWIINRRDIFIAFYEFKQHCLENVVEYRELDQYFNQLL